MDVLHRALLPRNASDKERALDVAVYRRVLGGIPPIVLAETVDLFATGQIPKQDLKFAPMPPQLRVECERRLAHWRTRADHLRMLLTLPEARAVPNLTHEEQQANERRAAKLLTLAAKAVTP